jgi:hypothetical protein
MNEATTSEKVRAAAARLCDAFYDLPAGPYQPTPTERAEMEASVRAAMLTAHDPLLAEDAPEHERPLAWGCRCGGCEATIHYKTARRYAAAGNHPYADWHQRMGDACYLGTAAAREQQAEDRSVELAAER